MLLLNVRCRTAGGSRDTLTEMATARRRLAADSPRRANLHVTATISLPGGRAGEKENSNSQLDAKMLPGTCYKIASTLDMLAKQTVPMKTCSQNKPCHEIKSFSKHSKDKVACHVFLC